MGIKVKMNGQWVDLHVLSGDTNVVDLNLLKSEWQEEQVNEAQYIYKNIVPVNNLNSQFRAIALLNYTGEDVFERIVCEKNQILIYATKIPENDIIGTAFYAINNNGAENRIYLVGGVTKEQLDEIIYQIETKIGIQFSSDGEYTDFTQMRQLEKAIFKLEQWTDTEKGEKNEQPLQGENEVPKLINRIVIDYQLQGGMTKKDYIYLDEHNYPVCGSSNDISWQIGWEGFDEKLI